MGKFQKRRGKKSGPGQNRYSYPARNYAVIPKENEKLEKYYNGIFDLPEEERREFWEAVKRELPNSFRFCGSKGHALAVRDLLQSRYFPEIDGIEYEGRKVELPQPVPWYPDNLAWSMTTPKNVIRKFGPFSAFQKFLVSETNVGHMTRQEVVSMIPPLLLDVRPGMAVLDMCAAPGSKSSQLLEMLHSGEEGRIRKVLREHAVQDGLNLGTETEEEKSVDLAADAADDGRATGLLVANDAEYKRCHMLTHQLKRLSSANVVVTNHDATQYPSIKMRPTAAEPNKKVHLKFDRVLADVPCSGDGTLRKNVGLWKSWVPGSALGLHLTQVRILVRALQLLQVGGRVVYSTCSMNPVENESVIAAAIDRCGGPEKIGIVDCSTELPDLKRVPGLKQWSVMDKAGVMWNNWADVKEELSKDSEFMFPGKLVESMFPPPEGHVCADLPLERCMRVYAHLQDTGGFFITALEKKHEFKARPEGTLGQRPREAPVKVADADEVNGDGKRAREEEAAVETPEQPSPKRIKEELEVAADDETMADVADVTEKEAVEAAPENATVPSEGAENGVTPTAASVPQDAEKQDIRPARVNTSIRYEDPFVFLPADHEAIQEIKKAYRLSDRFPLDRFFVRNASGVPAKGIYYAPKLSKEMLEMNDGNGVKIIHGGMKMFMKQDVPNADVCRWRIQAEGLPLIEGYVGEHRVVHLTKRETLRRLLIEMFPKITDDGWKAFDDIGERVRDMDLGCNVLRIEPDEQNGFRERIALPLWKSLHSLNLMLPKEDRAAMLLRLFNDTTPLVNNSLRVQQEKQDREDKAAAEAGDGPDADMVDVPVVAASDIAVPDADAPVVVAGEDGQTVEGTGGEAPAGAGDASQQTAVADNAEEAR